MATRVLEVQFVGNDRQLAQAFRRTGAQAGFLERRFGTTGAAAQRVGQQMGNLARRSVLPAGLALGAVVKTTVDFDRSMRNVNSIAQLGEKRFQGLSKRVLDLAGPTAQAPGTLAEGLYDLVSSGFNANQSMTVLRSSARAATAGLTDTATSTKAVAAVLNAYRQPAGKASQVSDTLFRTVDRGVITFEALAENIGDTLPFASSLGVRLHEVGAATATMTKQGLSSSETMTRIRNVLQTMIKPGEDLAAAFDELGVANGEALIQQKGFQGALNALVGTTSGAKDEVAKLFPNIRALGGVLALTGGNAQAAGQDLKDLQNSSGATARALSQQSKSVSFQWNRAKAVAAKLAIEVGTKMVPTFKEFLGILSDPNISGQEKLNRLFTLIGKKVTQLIPKLFEAGFKASSAMFRGFAAAWTEQNVLGKLLTGAALIRLLGGKGAFVAAGTAIGKWIGLGIGAGTASGAAAGVAGTAAGTAAAGGGARGLLGSMRTALGKIKWARVGGLGIGIALADSVISEADRQFAIRGDDLFASLEARASTGGGFLGGIASKISGIADKLGGIAAPLGVADSLFKADKAAGALLDTMKALEGARGVTRAQQREVMTLGRQANLSRDELGQLRKVMAQINQQEFNRVSGQYNRFVKQMRSGSEAVRDAGVRNLKNMTDVSGKNFAVFVAGMLRKQTDLEKRLKSSNSNIRSKAIQEVKRMARSVGVEWRQLAGMIQDKTSEIAVYLQTYLRAHGFTPREINGLISRSRSANPQGDTRGRGLATGGLAAVVPGQGPGDRHTLSLNGRPIAKVESQEGIFVGNRTMMATAAAENARTPRRAGGGIVSAGVTPPPVGTMARGADRNLKAKAAVANEIAAEAMKSRGGGTLGTADWDSIDALARRLGLARGTLTGRLGQPGSRHGIMGPGGRALATDYSGAIYGSKVGPMADFTRALIPWARRGKLNELFYDPLGGWDQGSSIGPIGDHDDHVHVAFQRGGLVRAARGGPVAGTSKDLPPGTITYGDEWKKRVRKAWSASGLPGGLPRVKVNTTPRTIWGAYAHSSPGGGITFGRDWLDDFHIQSKSGPFWGYAVGTLAHEFAHARQSSAVYNNRREAEGGATWYEQLVGPRIHRALGGRGGFVFGNAYPKETAAVKRAHDRGWALRGQFRGAKYGKKGKRFAGQGRPRHGDHWIHGGAPNSPAGPIWTVPEAATLLWQVGMDVHDAKRLARKVPGESSGVPTKIGYDPGGTRGLGLWQITTSYHDDLIRRFSPIFNPINNARAAKIVYEQRGGISQWYADSVGGTVHLLKDMIQGKKRRGGGSGGDSDDPATGRKRLPRRLRKLMDKHRAIPPAIAARIKELTAKADLADALGSDASVIGLDADPREDRFAAVKVMGKTEGQYIQQELEALWSLRNRHLEGHYALGRHRKWAKAQLRRGFFIGKDGKRKKLTPDGRTALRKLIQGINTSDTELMTNLTDIQGAGRSMVPMKTLSKTLGDFGGRILETQVQLRDYNDAVWQAAVDAKLWKPEEAFDETGSFGGGGATDNSAGGDSGPTGLTSDQLKQIASLASMGVQFTADRLGGMFHTGGIVPGPSGSFRTIRAMAGEEVLTKDERDVRGGGTVILADIYVGGEKIDDRVEAHIRGREQDERQFYRARSRG